MKVIKYFLEFFFISILFFIFKIIGYKNASNLGEKIGKSFGPLFRSSLKVKKNLENSNIGNSNEERERIVKNMWGNYGRIFADYMYIKNFRNENLFKNIEVVGENILEVIKNEKEPVIFISGHFNNFELMALYLEKSGIDLAAIYRPLNNKFLNPLMEKIRIQYICKKQIKKGISGTKEILKHFRNGTSIALMIDQRVSEGIKSKFVPVYIERKNKHQFILEILRPISFSKDEDIESITMNLNKVLEELIRRKPDQWIWTHSRWKQ